MSDVPDEILGEILSRLSVLHLLRFRCVSKSWKGLIDNQQFINHHLNHSRKTNSNLNIILNSGDHLYSSDFDLLNETDMVTFQELTHPFTLATYGRIEILGSCDGLLVLRNFEDGVTILCNPWVRRFHEIPFSGFEFPESKFGGKDIFYGFGYDVVSDDHKLIRIAQFHGSGEEKFNCEVKVFSLKSDSWRRIPDFRYYIDYRMTEVGVLASGALHWTLSEDNLVAAFDLGTEEFRLMPLPKSGGDDDTCTDLIVLGGCLSLMTYANKNHVDIWVMKEYGVEESWSILFTFRLCDFRSVLPLVYSECGRKVLLGLDSQVLMWYDLDKKSIELPIMLQMRLSENPYDMCTCLQSLVLLNNGSCDFELITKKKQERKD